MTKKRLVIVLVLLIIIQYPLVAEATDKNGKEGKPVPVLKVIPGVFQLKSRKILKGTLLLGAFCTAVAGAIIENSKGNKAYGTYMDSMNVGEIILSRQRTEDHFKARNYYISGMLAVFLLHVLDLKFYGGKKGIKSELSKDSFAVGLYYSF